MQKKNSGRKHSTNNNALEQILAYANTCNHNLHDNRVIVDFDTGTVHTVCTNCGFDEVTELMVPDER